MTDGAGLPLALSDLVATLCSKGLVDATVTCGHAFGGDYEAVSIFSALAVARHVAHADAAVVVMGPGIVGTNTRLGFSGMEVGPILDAAHALGGVAIACLRVSFADGRDRHVGLSHHSATALRLATRERVLVAVPELAGRAGRRACATTSWPRASTGVTTCVDVAAPDVLELFARSRPARSRRWAGPRPPIPRCSRPRPRRGHARGRRGSTVADRLERLVNLTATLLDTRRPLTLDELSERVEPRYPEDKTSRRRQFERDKETLRELGVPIRVETVDGFGAEQAYRIHPDDYYLPELSLTERRAGGAARRGHRGASGGRRRPRGAGASWAASPARVPTPPSPSST